MYNVNCKQCLQWGRSLVLVLLRYLILYSNFTATSSVYSLKIKAITKLLNMDLNRRQLFKFNQGTLSYHILPLSLSKKQKQTFKTKMREKGFPWWLRPWRISLQCRRPGFHPWVGKTPWKRAWQPTPVFLPGESPWTEERGGLQSMGSQSWTRLSDQQQHWGIER